MVYSVCVSLGQLNEINRIDKVTYEKQVLIFCAGDQLGHAAKVHICLQGIRGLVAATATHAPAVAPPASHQAL